MEKGKRWTREKPDPGGRLQTSSFSDGAEGRRTVGSFTGQRQCSALCQSLCSTGQKRKGFSQFKAKRRKLAIIDPGNSFGLSIGTRSLGSSAFLNCRSL